MSTSASPHSLDSVNFHICGKHVALILLAAPNSMECNELLSSTILKYHAEHLVSSEGLQTAIPY
jgi:hypothetical protein